MDHHHSSQTKWQDREELFLAPTNQQCHIQLRSSLPEEDQEDNLSKDLSSSNSDIINTIVMFDKQPVSKTDCDYSKFFQPFNEAF